MAVYHGPSAELCCQRFDIDNFLPVNKVVYIQDVQFCSPEDSACYTSVSKETSDCDISCIGLYADVVFTEDKILNLKTDLGKNTE